MLRNGAPIRQLQEVLGHSRLATTQLYTRVTINDLRAMRSRVHPASKGHRRATHRLRLLLELTPGCSYNGATLPW